MRSILTAVVTPGGCGRGGAGLRAGRGEGGQGRGDGAVGGRLAEQRSPVRVVEDAVHAVDAIRAVYVGISP